ncbi:MAG: prolipoprotein diacylglyceryl transferase [Candidatus Magasanikbacteria bacterium]|nr:prolipoprotein diacylglyceryl transferase [Candidatus Magasanikbacteria bacterium]
MIPYFGTTGWQIGFLKIQSWGLLVALGFLVGMILVWLLAKKQKLNQEKFLDLFVWIIIAALIGSRLFFVFFEDAITFYLSNPWEIFKIWQGGLSSFGGFLGAGLVVLWFWKKKKITWADLDILAWGFSFGWVIGRFGCLLIHDHLGILSTSFLAIRFVNGARLDMALMEIIMLAPLLALFAFKGFKLLKTPGLLSFILLLWYGIGRFFLDFLRAQDIENPDVRYLGFTVAQWGCVVLLIFSLKLLKKIKKGGVA